MSTADELPFETTAEVRDRCLCLHLQRAARAVARRFDSAFRGFDLTNGQFSLLMSLNRPDKATMRGVAALLAMDRTTLTAALKPLERRGLVQVTPDPDDRRSRRLVLTAAGRSLLTAAVPVWRREHAALDRVVEAAANRGLRAELRALSAPADGAATLPAPACDDAALRG
ncbi:MAG: MarR family transcriptional regulator [Alphaproteobacteria bacterium]|nr:MarR family transcriptional regulator [Alphaproteobacteria bacterium]